MNFYSRIYKYENNDSGWEKWKTEKSKPGIVMISEMPLIPLMTVGSTLLLLARKKDACHFHIHFYISF